MQRFLCTTGIALCALIPALTAPAAAAPPP
jgi:hypothetical protein